MVAIFGRFLYVFVASLMVGVGFGLGTAILLKVLRSHSAPQASQHRFYSGQYSWVRCWLHLWSAVFCTSTVKLPAVQLWAGWAAAWHCCQLHLYACCSCPACVAMRTAAHGSLAFAPLS